MFSGRNPRRESKKVDDLYDLKKASTVTGLGVERLRDMILDGRVTGYQPGGPKGKFFIPQTELERLRTPVRRRK